MLDAADRIATYVDRGYDAFRSDSAIRDAVIYQIVVLGEAAKAALSADATLATDFPAVPRSETAKMRDKMTHHYWVTDDDLVWATVTSDVPALRTAVADILSTSA